MSSGAPNATLKILVTLAGDDVGPEHTLRREPDETLSVRREQETVRVDPLPPGYVARHALGSGTVGNVWLAREEALDRDVALKVLRSTSLAAYASLVAEAKVLAQLEHPAIPPIYAFRDHEGQPFVSMRRIEGVSLRNLVEDPHHALWTEWAMGTGDRWVAVVEILARVAEALAHAHERGLVHRDVKPANVVVGPLGQAFLVDWGLAIKVGTLASTAVAGTPAYIAPEMVAGGVIDARTDVFLLGATLHGALTAGGSRHAGRTIEEVLTAALRCEPIAYDASVPPGLAALANEATAREPAARPENTLAFRDRLRAYRRDRLAHDLLAQTARPLAELEALEGRADPDAVVTAERLASVCRFVAQQADDLARNDRSAALRSRVGAALAGLYLARREPGPARAALTDVTEPRRRELAAAVAAIEADAEADAGRTRALETALREHDPSVGARARPWIALALSGVVTVAILVGRSVVDRSGAPEQQQRAVAVGVAWTVVVIGILLAFRRRLLPSRTNRTLAAMVATGFIGRVALRTVDLVLGAPSIWPTFARELVLFAAVTAVAAVATRLWMCRFLALIFSAGACAAIAMQEHITVVYNVTLASALLCALALGLLASRGQVAPSNGRQVE